MELLQAIAVRLLDLDNVLDDGLRQAEQTAVGAVKNLAFDLRLHLLFDLGDSVPGIAVVLLPLGIGGNFGAEFGFLRLFLGQDGGVGERVFAADVNLE